MAAKAQAQESDVRALALADSAPTATKRAGDLASFLEVAGGTVQQRMGIPDTNTRRASLDLQFDKKLKPGFRLLISDRLDMNSTSEPGSTSTVNTLREAYVSWQASNTWIFDLGRINSRNGVALGYNPTDYFRTGALRSVGSVDPASLKRNRQGSGMLRAQTLWDNGSLMALFSPKLSSQRSDAPFDVNLGATNHVNRWLVSLSTRISDGFNPQWLIFGEDQKDPQMGMNLTGLVNDATVAYAEWSGGRSRSLAAQASGILNDEVFRSRVAAGLTYTASNRASFTLEYQYNGAGLPADKWDALRKGSPQAYSRYRIYVQDIQDLVTKKSLFLYSTWPDALMHQLDLSAMIRFNLVDNSRMSWVEARHHWGHSYLAVQWQLNGGSRLSEFGGLPQRRSIQVLGSYYFH
jgi:hypothetical protein